MIKNYLLIALRNIRRNKLSSAISIFGLAIGITAAFLMLRYIQFELSYDQYHARQERIFRLSSVLSGREKVDYLAPTAMSVAPKLQKSLEEVEAAARVVPMNAVLKHGPELVKCDHFFQVDSQIFDIVDIEWLARKGQQPLDASHSLVITLSIARQLFGEMSPENMLGESVLLNNEILQISGIIADIPQNSDLRFNGMVALNEAAYQENDFQAFTYVLLHEASARKQFQLHLQEFDQHWYTPGLQKAWGTEDTYVYHKVIPIKDLHFTNEFMGDMGGKGNMSLIIVLSIIALFLIVIAAINFINLFIAQSIKRNVEVGIRKVVGARRSQLVWQYLSESVLFALISTILAVILIHFLEPIWYHYTSVSLEVDNIFSDSILYFLGLLLILIGLFAGSYAAFFLASSHPVKALKNRLSIGSKRSFHKVLQLLQFSIATGMIVCSLILYQQLQYLQNKQLGFDEEQLMVFSLPDSLKAKQKMRTFSQYLIDQKYTHQVTYGDKPGNLYLKGALVQEMDDGNIEVAVNALYADANYLDVLGINLTEGTNFTETDCECGQQYLINEKLRDQLLWEKPIGETLNFEGEGQIVGVVKDFHYQSLHYAIEPLIIIYSPEKSSHALLKIDPNKKEQIFAAWQTFFPNQPFAYSFLEQDLAVLYKGEKHMMNLFTFFSMLCILISCMGLFGMSAMNAQLKTKAMGIHKVMGARKTQLFLLLSKESLTTVCVAILIAIPLAALIMMRWLSHFEYHVAIEWWILSLASAIVFLLAFCTSSYHSFRISRTNPVLSLRDE